MASRARTPESAQRASKRWGIAGAVFGFTAAGGSFIGFELFSIPLLLAAFLCCMQSTEHEGWRRGWVERDRKPEVVDEHPWKEWNAYGNSCHYPGCQLDYGDHPVAGEAS